MAGEPDQTNTGAGTPSAIPFAELAAAWVAVLLLLRRNRAVYRYL